MADESRKKPAPDTTPKGEGDYEGARRYQEGAHETAKKVDVEKRAKEAEKELEKDPEALKKAEKVGKEKAKEYDPQVDRDFKKPKS